MMTREEEFDWEIRKSLRLHCPRRARHLCLILAEEYADNPDDRDALYRQLQEEYGIKI
jgi:hypothetical protein